MQPTTPNPTVSMSFIAGILILMSVFSVLTPKTEVSSQQEHDHSDQISLTQFENTLYTAY